MSDSVRLRSELSDCVFREVSLGVTDTLADDVRGIDVEFVFANVIDRVTENDRSSVSDRESLDVGVSLGLTSLDCDCVAVDIELSVADGVLDFDEERLVLVDADVGNENVAEDEIESDAVVVALSESDLVNESVIERDIEALRSLLRDTVSEVVTADDSERVFVSVS